MTLVYKAAKGVRIRVDTAYDLSGYVPATTLVKMTKPDGSTTTIAPTITGSRYMDFTTSATTFATSGLYKLQSHLVTATKELDGEIVELSIAEPIKV
jgi:uncharacterized membrane protein